MRVVKVTFLLASISAVRAFVVSCRRGKLQSSISSPMKMQSMGSHDSVVDRRTHIRNMAAGLIGTAVIAGARTGFQLVPEVETAVYAADIGTETNPIAVVGAGGKTGKLAVDGLLQRGKAVRAVTRTGEFDFQPSANSKATPSISRGDVTKIDTLKQALASCTAVIFCASASKRGGNAEAVDYQGLLNTAQACVDLGVPRLVVISSGAVTKPDSIGYKVTNIFGNIMTFKRKGELGLEEIYANAPKDVTFTVVRPGGLTDGPPVGPKGLELNQGDTIGGTINRSDVAEVAVEAALNPATENTFFEVYDKKTAGPLQKGFAKPSGYERTADTYPSIFQGLQKGVGV